MKSGDMKGGRLQAWRWLGSEKRGGVRHLKKSAKENGIREELSDEAIAVSEGGKHSEEAAKSTETTERRKAIHGHGSGPAHRRI